MHRHHHSNGMSEHKHLMHADCVRGWRGAIGRHDAHMINGLGDERVGSRRHGAHQFTPVSKQERSFSATMHTIAASIVQRSMARGACTNPGERARWLHAPGADHMHACDDPRTMQMCVDTLGFLGTGAIL